MGPYTDAWLKTVANSGGKMPRNSAWYADRDFNEDRRRFGVTRNDTLSVNAFNKAQTMRKNRLWWQGPLIQAGGELAKLAAAAGVAAAFL